MLGVKIEGALEHSLGSQTFTFPFSAFPAHYCNEEMPCKRVRYRHDGNVTALRAEIDFILLCQSFYKEFIKNVKRASSLKSEPLRKIRYRDDKITKKSITKKKAPCGIYTKTNPCYKFF